MKKVFLIFLFTCSLHAKDFGKFGESFPIQERSILDVIHERLSALGDDEIHTLGKKLQTVYEGKLLEPKPVPGIQKADRYEVHHFDPTITVHRDITDHENKVVVLKGTRFNPLSVQKLNRNLIFFDASDEEQVAWAKRESGAWILVKGKPLELEEKEKRAAFFDQRGVLTKRFGIKKVPTLVSQDGKCLKIESFPLGGEK